jgi:hypothetical protein
VHSTGGCNNYLKYVSLEQKNQKLCFPFRLELIVAKSVTLAMVFYRNKLLLSYEYFYDCLHFPLLNKIKHVISKIPEKKAVLSVLNNKHDKSKEI